MEPHIIGEVMTSEVVLAHRTTPFQELVGLLDRHRISGLPVVDHDDKVLGVVSGTDLARGGNGTLTAGDLMSTPAVTVHPEQAVSDAARVMERHGIERLPVVDEEDRLVGIATRRDLLRVFARTDATIRREVVDGIVVGVLGLPPESVDVTVRDGMVTLTGRVPRSCEMAPAVRSAWKIEGVVGVVNGLTYEVDDTGVRES
ncbi:MULTISPECIES: CBS domain-containing protein [Streptomyces]|uniref:CBS domain-containing protein n=1 Tax=Streptomyces gilvifuscus TaxID=1550617 RepID=A0ABT5FQN3_9ACTN|nr:MULTISPECIES: CBS domain-containing protein [Streptomyces]MDC2954800.1 CBS domain-containing protein [Streptomyces gilvifuscus]